MTRVAQSMRRVAHRLLSSPPVSHQLLNRAVVVFLYHEVSDQPSRFNEMFGLNVRPSVFSKQLDLIQHYFRVIDPEALLAGDYETPAALVTFDDGNRSYFQEALPILKAHRMPSVAFLNLGPIRGEVCWSGLVAYLQHFEAGFYESRTPRPTGYDFCRMPESDVRDYLDTIDADTLFERVRIFRGPLACEADLEAVSKEPLVHLGNHLYHHYNATLLSDRLKVEYRRNQEIVDAHPRGRRLFSYPFSCATEQTTRVLQEEGAQAIFGGWGLPNIARRDPVYARVELGAGTLTEQGLMADVLRNYASAMWRGMVG